ncbi:MULTISPECIES: TonB-dependent receptor [unclassified Pseudoxanthomonas]|uniref:TonB-dependent receptor n=1 Tax=unclassified Pseudoxanthomonas TaxID=2645906 RepID=UPI00161A2ED2|nr:MULTISPECIES: TonB-dependent receptor [unclassified Pseudoxanthomonas]MBB3277937.1 iron complex outermembrane receptor protein [Pseudoxanthomonas sp. OG2]MBV7474607.1 TonB-dependent receptor [Pseudoxanthomonas sp. PXM05]
MKLNQRCLVVGLRRALFGSCVLLGVSGTAWGQAAAAPDDATTLDTIKVTAQSREQELKDVPIAINVLNGEMIDQVAAADIGDLDMFVPGLEVSDGSPTQPRYAIRGISTGDFGIGTDPAVGVYIDGVYSARTGGAMLAFNDIERIEVLKGPQGTLFGRNSAAGAVSIITNKPSNVAEGNARIRVGEDGRRYLSGLFNVPFGERHALRFSALSNHSDGWMTDAATGDRLNPEDTMALRAAWRSDLGESTTLNLSWDYENIDQLARPAVGLVALDPYPAPAPYPANPLTYRNPLKAPVFNDVVHNEESRTFNGLTLQIDHAFPWGSLQSTTAVRDFDTVNREDEDGTNRINLYFDTANIESNRSYYQEFKFSGVSGKFDWVAGASWFKEEADQTSETNLFTDSVGTAMGNLPDFGGLNVIALLDQVLEGAGLPLRFQGHPWRESMVNEGKAEAYAAFGDVIWHVNDRLNLTFGLRLTHDRKEFSWFNGPREAATLDATVAMLEQQGFFELLQQMFPDFPITPDLFQRDFVFAFGELDGVRNSRKKSWTDVSPRFVVDYAINDNTMVFGSLAKGYKAGGFNSVQPQSQFDNEDVWNAEFGVKTVFPEQKLSLNASSYYYVYKDRQAISLDLNTAGSGVPRYVVDTSDMQAWGVDVDLQWRPVTGLDLTFNTSFIDATYKDGLSTNGRDISGDPTGEPYLSASFGAGYTWNLDDGGDVRFSLLHAYRGKSRCNAESETQGTCQASPAFRTGEAQNRTDMRVQWSSADGMWGVGVYGNNVFDKRYVTGVNNISASVLGTPFASISASRQVGVEFSARF